MKMTNILLKELSNKKLTKLDFLQQENAQLTSEVNNLKAELAKIHAHHFDPDRVIVNEELAPEFNIKNETKSYFKSLISYIKDTIKPLLDYSTKLRLPILFSYFRIALKLYAFFYLITGSLLLFSLNYDLVDHTLFLIKSYDYIIDTIKSSIVNCYDYFMRFIEKIFSSKSEPDNKWPDLEKYKQKRKELEKAQQVINDYKGNKSLLTDSSLSNDTNHWYDFIKSPWFYVPVITVASVTLIYFNFDTISNWFSRGGPDSDSISSNNPGSSSNIQSQASQTSGRVLRNLSREEAVELSRRFRTMEASNVTNQQSIPFLGLSSKYSINNPQIVTPVDSIELIDLRTPVSPSGSASSVETITQHKFNKIKND
jgi:hypothetical protein